MSLLCIAHILLFLMVSSRDMKTVWTISISCDKFSMPLLLQMNSYDAEPTSYCGPNSCLETAKVTCRAATKCDKQHEWVHRFNSSLQQQVECCSSDSIQISPIIRRDILLSGEIARFRGMRNGTYTFGEAIVRLEALSNGAIFIEFARYQCVNQMGNTIDNGSSIRTTRQAAHVLDPCREEWGTAVGSVPGQQQKRRRHQRVDLRIFKRSVDYDDNGTLQDDSPYCGVVISSIPQHRIA